MTQAEAMTRKFSEPLPSADLSASDLSNHVKQLMDRVAVLQTAHQQNRSRTSALEEGFDKLSCRFGRLESAESVQPATPAEQRLYVRLELVKAMIATGHFLNSDKELGELAKRVDQLTAMVMGEPTSRDWSGGYGTVEQMIAGLEAERKVVSDKEKTILGTEFLPCGSGGNAGSTSHSGGNDSTGVSGGGGDSTTPAIDFGIGDVVRSTDAPHVEGVITRLKLDARCRVMVYAREKDGGVFSCGINRLELIRRAETPPPLPDCPECSGTGKPPSFLPMAADNVKDLSWLAGDSASRERQAAAIICDAEAQVARLWRFKEAYELFDQAIAEALEQLGGIGDGDVQIALQSVRAEAAKVLSRS